MPKEVILNGFKVQVPLTPEAERRLDRIADGLEVLRSKLPKLSAWGVLSAKEFEAIDCAALELWMLALDLRGAHRAAAAPISSIGRKST